MRKWEEGVLGRSVYNCFIKVVTGRGAKHKKWMVILPFNDHRRPPPPAGAGQDLAVPIGDGL